MTITKTGKTQGANVVVDVVLAAAGHTGITVFAGGLMPLPARQLDRFVRASLDNLHKITDA